MKNRGQDCAEINTQLGEGVLELGSVSQFDWLTIRALLLKNFDSAKAGVFTLLINVTEMELDLVSIVVPAIRRENKHRAVR